MSQEVLLKKMDEGQITGAASSYARKYALNGLFCIDDGKEIIEDEILEESMLNISQVATIEELHTIYLRLPVNFDKNKRQQIIDACDSRKKQLLKPGENK